jgi:hypothetical protein
MTPAKLGARAMDKRYQVWLAAGNKMFRVAQFAGRE